MRWDLAFIAYFNFQNYNYAEFCRNRYQSLYRSTRSSVLLRIQDGYILMLEPALKSWLDGDEDFEVVDVLCYEWYYE